MSTDRWLDEQMWPIHTIQNDSAFKRKGILMPATTWMDLGGHLLSEMSPSQRAHCTVPLLSPSVVEFTQAGSGTGWGRERPRGTGP